MCVAIFCAEWWTRAGTGLSRERSVDVLGLPSRAGYSSAGFGPTSTGLSRPRSLL